VVCRGTTLKILRSLLCNIAWGWLSLATPGRQRHAPPPVSFQANRQATIGPRGKKGTREQIVPIYRSARFAPASPRISSLRTSPRVNSEHLEPHASLGWVYGGKHLWCGRLACTRDGGSRLHRATPRAADDVAAGGRRVTIGTQRGIAGIASRILQIRATSADSPLREKVYVPLFSGPVTAQYASPLDCCRRPPASANRLSRKRDPLEKHHATHSLGGKCRDRTVRHSDS